MNTIRPFTRLRPGDPAISAGNLNRALDELEAAASLSGLQSFGGPNPGAKPPQAETFHLWIRITGGSQPYAWQEVYYDDEQSAGSEWRTILDDDGQTAANFGTTDPDESIPAYEMLNNPSVAAGTIVRAWVHDSGTRILFRHIGPNGGGVYINASQVTEDQNALELLIDYTTIVYDFDDSHTINGFANGYPGRIVKVTNTSGYPQTITNESGSALVGDRVTTPNGADILWGAGATIDLLWDAVLGNWRVIGWTPPPTGTSSVTISGGGLGLVNDVASPGANYYYGTGPTGTRGWFSFGGSFMQWVAYTVLYTDFTDADTNQVLTLRTLTAYEMIHGAVVRNSVAFTAPGLSTANIKIGPDDNDALFISGHDLQTLNNWATNGTVGVSNLLNEHDYNRNSLHATKAVILTLDTTGANVNTFTAGALQVWLLVSTLPT